MNCATHPDEAITGTCERCGNFVCRLDATAVLGNFFCVACSEHPEVAYLDDFKRRLRGKRDGFAIWYGVLGTTWNGFMGSLLVLIAIMDAFGLAKGSQFAGQSAALAGLGLYALLLAALDAAYFFRVREVRVAAAVLPPIAGPFGWLTVSATQNGGDVSLLPSFLIGYVLVPFLVGVVSLASTRNKLAFEIDVTEKQIEDLWRLTGNNFAARRGYVTSLWSILFPLLLPVALVSSVVGLLRVDEKVRPPVGGRRQAIVGLIVSILVATLWTLLIVNL